MMTKNVGTIDKIFRIVVGILIIGAGIYFHNWWGLVGIVPLTTAFLNFCPAYLPLGLSTCKTETHESS